MMATEETTVVTVPASQVAKPWEAVKRTMFAVLAVAAPILLILAQILEEFAKTYTDIVPAGITTWALGTAGVLTVTAGFVTRIMAIPAVNEFLAWLRLKAEPTVQPVKKLEYKPMVEIPDFPRKEV